METWALKQPQVAALNDDPTPAQDVLAQTRLRLLRAFDLSALSRRSAAGLKLPRYGVGGSVALIRNEESAMRSVSGTLAEADSIAFNDPKFTYRVSLIQNRCKPSNVRNHSPLILALQS